MFANSEIILTKNTVLQKTVALLSNLQGRLLSAASGVVCQSSPKISRGENYLGLPYAILDYPRIAKGQDLYFIRNFFWWGNFYSSTLQLAGTFKTSRLPNLEAAYDTLAAKDYHVGVNTDPWIHHFEPENFQQIAALSKEAFSVILEETPHVKIAVRWPLTEWDSAEENLMASWKLLTALAKAE